MKTAGGGAGPGVRDVNERLPDRGSRTSGVLIRAGGGAAANGLDGKTSISVVTGRGEMRNDNMSRLRRRKRDDGGEPTPPLASKTLRDI